MEVTKNYNKTILQTSFTSLESIYYLLQTVKEHQPMSSADGKDTIFPTARARISQNRGGEWSEEKRDTHAELTLREMRFIRYVDENESIFEVSDVGNEFLDAFQLVETPVESGKVTLSLEDKLTLNEKNQLLLDILIRIAVVNNTYGRNIRPYLILFKLLTEPELDGYITKAEWASFINSSKYLLDDQYPDIRDQIIEFRKNGEECEAKKSDRILTRLVLWKVLSKANIPNETQACFCLDDNFKKIVEINMIHGIKHHEGLESNMDHVEKLKNCLEIELLPRKNKIHSINFIIYGAPGTGKTYSTAEYALAIVENREVDTREKSDDERKDVMAAYKALIKKGQVVFTTFHQSYGYEEFIQGLRPDTTSDKMSFKTVDGVFKRIADTALNDADNNYVIIIDEINRANISKVFGELITLLEEDKRWGELNETSVTLQSGDQFAVPNNLYIVGTMNSADKSISLIDAALRRRFAFIEQRPAAVLVNDTVLRSILENINLSLVQELDSTDLLVGHSYFMGKTEKDLCSILNNNIIPLLYEYFYDNRKKVANLLQDAINKSGAKVEIVDEKVGRLRVKDKVE